MIQSCWGGIGGGGEDKEWCGVYLTGMIEWNIIARNVRGEY